MKIVVVGGTGLLGKSLKKINEDLICFGSEMDIYFFSDLEKKLDNIKPNIIINAAAIKSNEVLLNKESAININIIGSANLAKYCIKKNIKLVYISTDYIYSGYDGNYKESDCILPENIYAWTKLAGESSTKLVEKHLIIRTSFGSDVFPYETAYDNLYVSKDYVDIISEKILKIILTEYVGVVNVGTKRKSMYDFAIQKNIVNRSNLFKSKDFSLNTELYEKLINNKNNNYIFNNTCPITGKMDKFKYIDLGDIPIVNNLNITLQESLECEKYPLSVSIFKDSSLSALDVVINPDKMFSNYLFRSDTNKPYFEHCKNMYKYLCSYIKLNKDDLCVDIGGNDGTLLLAFNEISKELNHEICEKINIEPSKNISEISIKNGIKTINEYFSDAIDLEKKPKLIVSTNVFQHLHNIRSFLYGINKLLDDDGLWCLEFPYWANSMDTNQFDQIYHEHLYYYLVTPLYNFFKQNNLKILNVTEHYIHGGSLRLLISKQNSLYLSDNTINYYLVKEKKYDENYYLSWSTKIYNYLTECKSFLNKLEGNIVGFGAAAKGCVFLNTLKIDYNTIKYVIDDTLIKQNRYIPGTGIKIVDRNIIKTEKIDFILILAHNFADYIIKSLRKDGYDGKFIIFLPDIKIIQ